MKNYRYRFTVEHINPSDDEPQHEPLVFEAESHDEINHIIELVRQSNIVDAESTAAMVVGQKLLGEIVKKNRDDPLFKEFWPQFVTFMKGMKAQVKK